MSAWRNILGWFERRANHGYRAGEMPRIVPVLLYDDVPVAADWLVEAFGFWCRGKMGAAFAELELAGELSCSVAPRTNSPRRGR